MNTRRVERTCDQRPTNMDATEIMKILDSKFDKHGAYERFN